MIRNHTAVRNYLLSLENERQIVLAADRARAKAWESGHSDQEFAERCLKANAKYNALKKEITEKIGQIQDANLRYVLTQRFVLFKEPVTIRGLAGWSERCYCSTMERALMAMELILVENGTLTFVNPESDMMAGYEDGYQDGYDRGRDAGYDEGYEEGYRRGEEGLPYEMDDDDEYGDVDEDDNEYEDEEDDEDDGADEKWDGRLYEYTRFLEDKD